jgi:predicted metal-binding membrane protein
VIPAAVVEIVWHRDRRVVVVGLALATAAAWAWTLGGMDMAEAGSAAMLPAAWSPGHAAWMFAMWWVMMAAMMLPGAVPLVLTAAAVHRRQCEAGRPELTAGLLAAGYLAVWGLFSLAATLAQRALEGRGLIAPGAAGVLPAAAGWLSLAAGLYQLTPLKDLCLRHCRGPMHFILHGWREGRTGALRMGTEHGLYCVGCCWGLMVILFVLGVMSLFWMAAVAAIIFAEKVLPYGLRLSRIFALAFIAFGIWIAVAPSSVPGLTDPSKAPSMMEMDKMGERMEPANGNM